MRRLTTANAARSLLTAGVLILGTAFPATSAPAQSGRKVMVEDDGGGPHMTHFSMPDFGDLRSPDLLKRDVPLFTQRLILSAEQAAMVDRAIEDYLKAFEALRLEKMAKLMPQGMVFTMGETQPPQPKDGPGAGKGAPVEAQGMPLIQLGGGDDGEWADPGDFEMDEEGELAGVPRGTAIGLTVSVGGPDGGDGDGGGVDGGSDVGVSIMTPDGQELSPEQRAKLEAQAQEIAKKIQAQLEAQKAAGGDEGDAHGMLAGPMMDKEAMAKQEAEIKTGVQDFRKAKAQLRQSFVTDVQTKLAEPQIERWPSLDRALYRERKLSKGRISGERTDLVKVLDSMKLNETARQSVAADLENYEMSLDTALKARDAFLVDSTEELDAAMNSGNHDKALSIMDKEANLRIAIRTVNEQSAQLIESKLAAETAAAFRAAALRMSYPDIYKQTRGQKTFAAAHKIEGLDAKTVAAIDSLETAYGLELAEVNNQIRAAVNKYQPLEPQLGMAKMMNPVSAGAGGSPDIALAELGGGRTPIRDAFAKRTELDNKYRNAIAGMLTPEQAESLPKVIQKKDAGKPIIIRREVSPN